MYAPRRLTPIALLAIVVTAVAASRGAERQPAPSPLEEARRAAADLPQLHTLVASHRGTIVLEHYAHGAGADRLANVKSVSKSVIAALVGIAIERKLIEGLQQPIADFFPELRRDPDPRKRAITIENLLTMQAGLESTSGENYGRWVLSGNWVRHALARPMIAEPGTGMQYSTGSSHLLSAILTKASGTSTWAFAQQALARPLGFSLARWRRDPQGIYFGGNEMLMTPRQMLAFGELYLHRGRVNGTPIVPASWVDASCRPRTTSRWDPDRQYGYGWWTTRIGTSAACFAWGYGGQYILVFDDLDLVIAATSSTTVSEERRGHRRRLLDLVERHIVAPLRGRDTG